MAIVERAKANVGKDKPKMNEMNKLARQPQGSAFKTTEVGAEYDSGSTDSELSSAAGSLYSDAAGNRGDSKGDHAIQNR